MIRGGLAGTESRGGLGGVDGGSSSSAPTDATYWTASANGTLSAEKDVSTLVTNGSIVKNNAGAPAPAVPNTDHLPAQMATATPTISGANAKLIINQNAGGSTGGLDLQDGGVSRATVALDASANVVYSGRRMDYKAVTGFSHDFYVHTARHWQVTDNGGICNGRFQTFKGSDVASAATLTLGSSPGTSAGNVFNVTGVTAVDFITTTGWQAGSEITLILKGAITLNHNTGSPGAGTAALKLAGAANLVGATGDMVKLVYDGTVWRGGLWAATGA